MSTMRLLPARDYYGIKAACRALVERVGGPSEASRATRLSQPDISRCISADDQHEKRFLPIDVVADLEAACNVPIGAHKLAELSGHILVPLPAAVTGNGAWAEALGALSIEDGEVLMAIGQAIMDGKITAAERDEAKRRILDAHRALARVSAMLDMEVDR